ncbi:glycosyltransferase [Candidatus Binatia bacterium]|nr:glycosyltransferase [Candidatus Binatia bacterium]
MATMAAVVAVVWCLHAILGRHWRIEPRLAAAAPAREQPRVVAVVPARNEATELPRTLGALLLQDEGLHVVLVDDHSSDDTAEVARGIAADLGADSRLTVLAAALLPAGWTGKVWAQHQGVEAARARGADWIWLTDADIHHAPGVLARLLATAAREGRDMVSVMARLRCDNLAEKLLIPAFTYFFATLYSFRATANDRARTAGAAGGCVLVRATLVERIGGMAAIRHAVIDDCALARACKDAGGKLWLGYDAGVVSTRGYPSLGAVWDMVARSAYTQLRLDPLILLGCIAGLAFIFLVPVAAIVLGAGVTRALGLLTYAAMIRTYLPMVRWLGCAPAWAAALPLSATLYAAMTVSSAWRHHRGAGAAWKGRAYGADGATAGPPSHDVQSEA